ncbi:MAG: hypothetical protein AAF921_05035 [Cyanobacteria bacterium P01_D01_bin.44]
MGNDDVLILTIYALVVFYVLYKMALSYEELQEDQIEILLDLETLDQKANAQLSHQSNVHQIQAKVEDSSIMAELFKRFAEATGGEIPKEFKDPKKMPTYKQITLTPKAIFEKSQSPEDTFDLPSNISIAVRPQGKNPLKPPIQFLRVEVNNRTVDYQVYIDWDRCTITYFSKQGQRVIRMLPVGSIELSQRQVYSVINPGQQLRTDVTTEGNFSRNAETQRLEASNPMIDVGQLAALLQMGQSKGGKPGQSGDKKSDKPREASDKAGKSGDSNSRLTRKSLYSLTLWISVKALVERESQATNLLLPFSFDVVYLEGQIAFLPLRILLDWLRNRVENVNTTFTGTRARR